MRSASWRSGSGIAALSSLPFRAIAATRRVARAFSPCFALSSLLLLAVAAPAALLNAPASSAEILPPGCDTTFGGAKSTIRVVDAPALVAPGEGLRYRVGTENSSIDSDVTGCDIFDVDVFIRLPGEGGYEFVCNIPSLPLGVGAECEDDMPYVAEYADATGELLLANVRAIGNKHDRAEDCVIEAPRAGNGPVTECFDASATSNIAMVPPTPTPTATPLPTDTPQPPPPPPPRPPAPTGTAVPPSRTPTRVSTVLSSGPVSAATPAVDISSLPTAGGGLFGLGSGGYLLVAAAIVACAFGGGALVLRGRRGGG